MKYICQICGYIYDDSKEKVPFETLPETWHCPLCGAAKSDFKPEQTQTELKAAVYEPTGEAETELSFGQLAAVCSNLARGCEKLYKDEEARLFSALAEYFTLSVKPVNDASAEKLSALLLEDVQSYPSVRSAADAAGDRGAARVCVWGEKVSRMLSSLVSRYLTEGEKMLEGTSVWVCTVCGFVYIGDKAPEKCPVCKVPDWKFQRIEGRAQV